MNNIREEYKKMAKKIKHEEVQEKNGTKLTNEGVIEDLEKQLKHYEGMLLKTQGALEVLKQIEQQNSKA